MNHTVAWFESQPFAIGDRVQIVDAAEREAAGGEMGGVVGYDAAGPRKGEQFIRVLVMLDGQDGKITAIPPHCLQAAYGSERHAVAKSMLVEMERVLTPEQFSQLLDWLRSEACAQLLEQPEITRKRIDLGKLGLPGFLLADLRQHATKWQSGSGATPGISAQP